MSLYLFYRCVIIRDGKVIAAVLRRGRFLNRRHFHNLLKAWSGKDADGCSYLFYETADPGGMSIPPLACHENTRPELAV